MTIETGSEAPDFDLEVDGSERARLADFRGRRNVLLVFHPFAFTPVCEEEAHDLQENLPAFAERGHGRDPRLLRLRARRDAPGRRSSASPTRSPRTSGRTARPREAYGVFDDEVGAAVRGTFLIDKDGVVVWSLVNEDNARRTDLAAAPLAAHRE